MNVRNANPMSSRLQPSRLRSRRCDGSPSERGAVAVEFAIILPVLVILLFGIIQFALAFNRLQGLHAAAREGARIASIPGTTVSDVNDRVGDALDGVAVADPTVTVSATCDGRSGETVVVEVAADSTIDIPLWGTEDVHLTGRGEFRCE